jgi:hypothetical protein
LAQCRVARVSLPIGCHALSLVLCWLATGVAAQPIVFNIAPSLTDARIRTEDHPHYVAYDRGFAPAPILLWLAGTGGHPHASAFEEAALALGYRVLALSYVDEPAVAQVCRDASLASDPNCAAKFRRKRIFGDDVSALIDDAPQDAILNRFTMLLRYLALNDQAGDWQQYLQDDQPRWDRVALAGQSQGGGMAAFLAKRQAVAKVIVFSGGWDYSGPGKIAAWYREPSRTPPERWYGTYHAREPNAATIAQTYEAMGIPRSHQLRLTQEVRAGKKAHGEGASNPQYRDLWLDILRP